MLYGTYPAGRVGSVNVPASVTLLKLASNESIFPFLKSAANRLLGPLAKPVYTAPSVAVNFTTADVALTAGFQPEIVPDSDENRNSAEFVVSNLNDEVPLKTWPVGPIGVVTISDCGVPLPLYSVA